MTEYSIKHSKNVLIVSRTKAWFLSTMAGMLVILVGTVLMLGTSLMQWKLSSHFGDRFGLFLSVLFLGGMLFVGYRLTFWGRSLVFDREENQFFLDGRKICTLSDLTSVNIEGSQRSPLAPSMGQLQGLHLRTVQGKDIVLKWAWESSPEHRCLAELALEIGDFVRVRHSGA